MQGFRGEIETIRVPGGEAGLARWRELREQTPSSGFYPVILSDDVEDEAHHDNVVGLRERFSSLQQILVAGDPGLIAERVAVMREELEEDELEVGEVGEPAGEGWRPSILFDEAGDAVDEVGLALVNAGSSEEAVAELCWGGINECPSPEEQVVYLRSWRERFGAELIGLSRDEAVFSVEHPPMDPDAALSLAWELFGYCPDVVYQGMETVGNVGSVVRDARFWSLWWD